MRGGKKIIGEQKNRPAVALKNILRHSLIYSAGNFFNKTVAFLLVPFYTHYLVPAEYGTLSLIEITSYIIEMFLAAGISQSIMRFYHEQESVAEKKLLVSSSLITSAAFSFFGLIPFMFLTDFMSAVIFESTRYSVLLKIMLATLFFSMTSEVSLTYLRIKEKSLEYNVAVILRTLLSLTLNIVFVAVFRWGVSGILISSLISIALNGIVLNWLTTREIGFGFSLPHVFEMLKYGLPYIPSGLGMFVINFSDRYFLQRLSSLEELGVYSLGFKFGMIFQFLIFEPFMLIWGPKRFEVARQDNGSRVITRVFTYFCFIQIFAGLSLCLVIKDVMSLVASPAYQQAYRIVPWIVLSYFLLSIYFHIQIGILLKKKTKIIALIIGAAVGIKILLSIILIPRLHGLGAAAATLGSFSVMFVLNYLVSRRYYEIPFEYSRIAKLVFLGVAMYLAVNWIPLTPELFSIAVKSMVAVSFPLLLYYMGFFDIQEIGTIKRYLVRTGVMNSRLKEADQ